MADPTIHVRRRTISASMMLEAIGEALGDIKRQDALTDTDLGAVLGKSDDQAAKYRTGLAEMGLVAFVRGCERWGGRFANPVLALIDGKMVDMDAAASTDRKKVSAISRLAARLSEALEDNDLVDPEELAAAERALEEAGQAIDHYRQRLHANVALLRAGR